MGKEQINYSKEVAILRHPAQWLIFLLSMVILVTLPLILLATGGAAWFTFFNVTFITIIAILGLNIITGMAGQISLGHAAFVMVGAYTSAILIKQFDWPFWGALPASAMVSAILGMVVGAPSLRLKGFYLAVATLAFFLIAQFILRRMDLSGGVTGIIQIPGPSIGSLIIDNETDWYYFSLGFMCLFIFFSTNLARSRLGRAFFAIRDNDAAASSLGIWAYPTKLRAFFIGNFFAGAAGSLLASYLTVVRPEMFSMWDSIWYLGMISIGGAGSTAGAVLGVIFLRLIGQVLQLVSIANFIPSISNNLWVFIISGIYGLIIVVFISFQPHGILGLWKKFRMRHVNWPFGLLQ